MESAVTLAHSQEFPKEPIVSLNTSGLMDSFGARAQKPMTPEKISVVDVVLVSSLSRVSAISLLCGQQNKGKQPPRAHLIGSGRISGVETLHPRVRSS